MRPQSKAENEQFNLLWSVLPHPPESVVRMFSRGGDDREGDFARTKSEVAGFARAYRDRNVYVAPNPTRSIEGARHSAKDVSHWSYFLIDMDPVEEKCDPRAAIEEALLWIGEWIGRNFTTTGSHPDPPIIIDSGRGMQAWIRLEDILFDDVDPATDIHGIYYHNQQPISMRRAVARRVNGYWLKKLDERLGVIHGCRIDTSVSDLPRVMRCPGTYNVKTGRMAKFVHAHDRKYVGVASLLTVGTPKAALTDPEPVEGLATGLPWQEVFAHLTRMAQVYLTQGQAEPGRHKVMWHTAKKLRELGVSRRETKKALVWANTLKGEDEALPPDQIKHALDTAYSV